MPTDPKIKLNELLEQHKEVHPDMHSIWVHKTLYYAKELWSETSSEYNQINNIVVSVSFKPTATQKEIRLLTEQAIRTKISSTIKELL